MTEEEARIWLSARFDKAEIAKLATIVDAVRSENERQNLVAPSTLDVMWARHVVDSAQLVPLANEKRGSWLDVGSGAGFPGLVVAALRPFPITLVEPRRRRADFLRVLVEQLSLTHVEIRQHNVERLHDRKFAIISARAVAAMDRLFALTAAVTLPDTVFLLQKGQRMADELEQARTRWHGTFHVEQSLTNDASGIIVARGVRARR